MAGKLPGWAGVLQMAEAWATPPWQVLGIEQPNAWERWKWVIRQREYSKAKNRREAEAVEGARGKWPKR